MRFLYGRTGYVIAISSYLADFYRAKGCQVIRVPPLVDLTEPKWQAVPSKSSHVLRLVYAGNPGRKDLLANIIRGLALLGNNRRQVELHLVGVTPDQVAAMLGTEGVSPLPGTTIIWRDKVSQSCVPQILAGCDYSVLLRPHSRYAEAGFPTKFVESLSAGLPVITNVTSDISEYLQDLDQGVIVPGYTPSAFAKAVERVITLSSDQHQRMREKARARAMLFDYRTHAPEIGQFVSDAIRHSS
jgi:glycosyltransferase involved in cell wall biosynthesis